MKGIGNARDRDGKRQIGPLIDAGLYIDIRTYCKHKKISFQEFVEAALRERFERVSSIPETTETV